jgi:hypothetical protein
VLEKRAVGRLWRHQPIRLRVEAVNLSEANFAAIEIEVHIPGEVRSWPDQLDQSGDAPALPHRPAVLGTPKRLSFGLPAGVLDATMRRSYFQPIPNTPSITAGPGYTVRDTGSVTVNFHGVDLRPEQRLSLPAVPLLVDADEGTVLDCEWTATARNVPRRPVGTVRSHGWPVEP